jgi:hypothetical protein
MMIDEPRKDDEDSEAEAMEEVQEEAAHEREDEGGYQ